MNKYVSKATTSRGSAKPSRKQRWTHSDRQSMNDWAQLPKGWNIDEPDLDPQDLEAQIQRCKERIKDNIMPYIFRIRLKVLEEAKANRDAIIAPYQGQGLSWDVIQRLESLKALRDELMANGDAFEELPNVDAIIRAYESGDLKMDGQITYWSYGRIIHRSNAFDWDQFSRVNRMYQGFKAFWVERGEPGPSSVNSYKAIFSADNDGQYVVPLVLRLGQGLMEDEETANTEPEIEFDFIDDTGCGPLRIYADDVALIQGPNAANGIQWPWPQLMGYESMKSADGTVSYILAIMVEVNMYDAPKDHSNRQLMIPAWVPAVALVDPGKSIGPAGPNERLSGRWMRYSLFTATAPGPHQSLYISSTKTGLTERNMLPKVDAKDIKPMRPLRSRNGAIKGKEGLEVHNFQP
ncbi:hypothetical protein N7520_004104 [Penicillium odoratum]|uniref:uncharacterized protein n=1 Tax=Penicillium odoratum TaxID=1167516 RepID=UPI0025488295|nr:uncharacterized protein N7520_004104 [Penicillium odoratum]KAJ5769545.1 hypothetical protein N7520_004104 [Penicillium odoratum]